MYKVTMSTRGQIVIPAELRRKLGLKGGTRFRLYDSQGKLSLVAEVEDPVNSGLGFLRRDLDEEAPEGPPSQRCDSQQIQVETNTAEESANNRV